MKNAGKRMDAGRFPQWSGWPARQGKREMDVHNDAKDSREAPLAVKRARRRGIRLAAKAGYEPYQ